MSPSLTIDIRHLLSVVLCGVLFAMPLLVSPPAHAQDDSEQRAEQLFAEGRDYFEDGQYNRAAENFVEAYDILDVPELLYNIGQAYRRADDLVKAEHYFQQYLNETQNPPNEDAVADMIIDMQQQLAARKATVDIATVPENATIFIDDDEQCQTPCQIELTAGEYTLRAEREGYEPVSRPLELDLDEEAEQHLRLEEIIAVGDLFVDTDVDDATLVVDGDRYPLPHREPITLEAGPHNIAIESHSDSVEHDIEIDGDDTLHLFVPVADAVGGDFSALRASAIGLGGASLAMATAATITGLQARSTHRRLEGQLESAGAVDPDLVDTGRDQKMMTNGLWLGAITALGAGAGLWAWEWYDNRDEPQQLEPTDDPDGDGEPDIDML